MIDLKRGNYFQRDQDHQRGDPRLTTEVLDVGTQVIKCVFCKGGHYPDKCTVITNVNVHMEFSWKHRLYFKCLGSQHNPWKCTSNMKCFSCRNRNHHTTISKQIQTGCKDIALQQQNSDMFSGQSIQNNNNETILPTSLMVVNQNPVFL